MVEMRPTLGRMRGDRPAASNPVPPKPPKPASPINWWALGPFEQRETLSMLSVWVPQLVRRYALPDTTVPPCWYEHEPLIQELLALYQYRDQQQVLPTAPPQAMLDFHYQFDIALGRIRRWVGVSGCNSAEHRADVLPLWADEDTERNAQWQQTFITWLNDRTDALLDAGLREAGIDPDTLTSDEAANNDLQGGALDDVLEHGMPSLPAPGSAASGVQSTAGGDS